MIEAPKMQEALKALTRIAIILAGGVCCFVCRADDYSSDLAKSAYDYDPDLAKLPQLSPDKCAEQSPDEMYKSLEAQYDKEVKADEDRTDSEPPHHQISGFYFSEGGEDSYYRTYAHQLRQLTDKEYPKVSSFHEALVESFQLCADYVLAVSHRNGHESERASGRVEWILYQGSRTGYQYIDDSDFLSEADYRPELIEQIGLNIAKANGNLEAESFETEMHPVLKKCLARLADAESTMSDRQKAFFRRQLVLFMARYM